MSANRYHAPVLLQDCIRLLNIKPHGSYIDATFGGGGHSLAILDALGPKGRLLAFDQDEDVSVPFKDARFTLLASNFRYMQRQLRLLGVNQVDGILADLGVSSHQFDTAERGFSYRFNHMLDMRMNQKSELTAHRVVNTYTNEDLTRLFKTTTDLKHIKALVRSITDARVVKPINTTTELAELLKTIFNTRDCKQDTAQVFQAIRIEVNQELAALSDLLNQSKTLLKPGGRLVILSYHSIEDRLVKQFIKTGNTDGVPEVDPVYGTQYRPFTEPVKNPIQPSDAEILNNPRARSAKLRVAEKPYEY
jgi:16S rRNA (cytosine1402-N4)-methyltransferase